MRPAFKSLELRLRNMTPAIARTTYRLVRSIGKAKTSQPLPPELVENCRLCANRVHMLDFLPHKGIVAELGTETGNFARKIISRTNPTELHLVDLDYSKFSDEGLVSDHIHKHQGLTTKVIASFDDEYFDWVYIDADHSYEGSIGDARAAADKIKPGGYLVFNDFAHIDPFLGRYGVHRAAVDFAVEASWPLRLFAYQASALYDVALQKPPAK